MPRPVLLLQLWQSFAEARIVRIYMDTTDVELWRKCGLSLLGASLLLLSYEALRAVLGAKATVCLLVTASALQHLGCTATSVAISDSERRRTL